MNFILRTYLSSIFLYTTVYSRYLVAPGSEACKMVGSRSTTLWCSLKETHTCKMVGSRSDTIWFSHKEPHKCKMVGSGSATLVYSLLRRIRMFRIHNRGIRIRKTGVLVVYPDWSASMYVHTNSYCTEEGGDPGPQNWCTWKYGRSGRQFM